MPSSRYDDRRPVLIEQTAKKYKAARGGGILILFVSAAIGVISADDVSGIGTVLTGTGAIIGILVFVWGTLLSWWHHG